jgi:hypothetical protein
LHMQMACASVASASAATSMPAIAAATACRQAAAHMQAQPVLRCMASCSRPAAAAMMRSCSASWVSAPGARLVQSRPVVWPTGWQCARRGFASSSGGGRDLRSLLSGLGITRIIIGINAVMFLMQMASNGRLTSRLCKSNWHIRHGELWRLVSPAFLHADWLHLAINCYSLYQLGGFLEPVEVSQHLAGTQLRQGFAQGDRAIPCPCRRVFCRATGALLQSTSCLPSPATSSASS